MPKPESRPTRPSKGIRSFGQQATDLKFHGLSGEDLAATFMDVGGAASPKGVSGRSFYPLLKGESYQPREYIFGARLYHGNNSFGPETKASTFDLSRCVRGNRWKFIYNLTPQMEYWPVDSGEGPG